MKFAVVLLGLIALACSAPQPRKAFHEHFEDFLDVIMAESSDDIVTLVDHYMEFEEFVATLDYLRTANFKDLVYEMESLPEFRAVIEYLENDNIDILFFLDMFNGIIDDIVKTRKARISASGTNLNSYIADSISAFPKEKLAALFDQKKAEDEDFRVAVENLESEEWDRIFTALWANEVFQKEIQTLAENGIDVHLLLAEVRAIFGQN